MRSMPQVISWFRSAPLPGIVPDPAIILGGTRLLREFLTIASSAREQSHLAVAAPFIGRGIGQEIATWETLPHRLLDLRVVTQSVGDARMACLEIGRFGWRSMTVVAYARLHAKLYTFMSASGGGACLVGSHNLTSGGARLNEEAGVLFVGSRDPELGQLIGACHDRILTLGSRGRVLVDSLRWPKHKTA
jgi:hypothetical protein